MKEKLIKIMGLGLVLVCLSGCQALPGLKNVLKGNPTGSCVVKPSGPTAGEVLLRESELQNAPTGLYSNWLAGAQSTLSGTWANVDPASVEITKMEITREGPHLLVRFWSTLRDQAGQASNVPMSPDRLAILEPRPQPKAHAKWSDKPSGVAFGLHRDASAVKPFTLRFSDNFLKMEYATIFTDNSKQLNYYTEETFRKQ